MKIKIICLFYYNYVDLIMQDKNENGNWEYVKETTTRH